MAIFVLFIEGCNAVIFLVFAQYIPSLLPLYFLGVAGNVTDRTDRDYHLRKAFFWVLIMNPNDKLWLAILTIYLLNE